MQNPEKFKHFLKNLKNVKFDLENSTKMNFNIFGYVSCLKSSVLHVSFRVRFRVIFVGCISD